MSEKRLSEITSTISMMNGTIVVLGYFHSLPKDEQDCIINHINKETKYKDEKDIISKIILFSKDYVEKHGKMKNNSDILNFGYKEGNYEDYFKNSGFTKDYLDQYMEEEIVEKSGKSRR